MTSLSFKTRMTTYIKIKLNKTDSLTNEHFNKYRAFNIYMIFLKKYESFLTLLKYGTLNMNILKLYDF